jgi:hypothetical protein
MAKRHVDQVVSFKLRLPEGLRQKLEAEAQKSERSINSEILWRLGQTFGEEWQRFVARMEERERSEQELRERIAQDPKFQKLFAEMIAKHKERQ